ncbi:hypothetical protein FH972_002378 [Carpinus fangiana]|uniref:Transmembrane protein n=1 Tax=Carpinus fangiana TaxID=176857 RepID=A0A5N6QHB1_9ROSI|nr:hypothetical protein FH972_002378 [Carpinus fangiana]
MSFSHMKGVLIVLLIFTILFASPKLGVTRPLEGEQWLIRKTSLEIIQSLQRGPVTPSGANPCTYIPGRSTGTCT